MELNVARVRLPRDLHPDSVATLRSAFDAALASPATAVVLVGADGEIFCLGLALGGAHPHSPATDAFADLLLAMHRSPKPLIAAVDGRAIGGGMGLACACDWVVATERSVFALPELLWGLLPAVIWPVITDRMAPHVARQWVLTAHARGAAEGVGCGLVDALTPVDRFDAAIGRAARMLQRLEPEALVRFRGWSRAARSCGDLCAALHGGAAITTELMRTPEVRRRWQAFADGEAPW